MSVAVLPEGWPRPPGYAEARVARNGVLAVAGQLGVGEEPRDFAAQWAAALERVVAVVAAAGGAAADVLSLRIFVCDLGEYERSLEALGAGFTAAFGRHFPASTLVEVRALVDPAARVEVEALAVVPVPAGPR